MLKVRKHQWIESVKKMYNIKTDKQTFTTYMRERERDKIDKKIRLNIIC